MFGVDGTKLFVLLILAAFLLGPTRLTAASAWLGRTVRQLRDFTDRAKDRARGELGTDFDDWKSLDPRQYDPRRIIAEALLAPPEIVSTPRTRLEAEHPSVTDSPPEKDERSVSAPSAPPVAGAARVADPGHHEQRTS
ncbi:hypothetical protein [Microbacterium sp. T32]|uniref:hypothetical protein n=1 Tax=Microbacterium sp. T32 TaxID=1776083 RepID=UPI000ABF7B2B|nr:hypothetical protein [Microbacterium sp. T32]